MGDNKFLTEEEINEIAENIIKVEKEDDVGLILNSIFMKCKPRLIEDSPSAELAGFPDRFFDFIVCNFKKPIFLTIMFLKPSIIISSFYHTQVRDNSENKEDD